jgi:TATA-binding protein-associated factor
MDEVILYLGDTNNDTHRQGAVETISYLLQNNEMDILCYIVLLVMPILGRMSDQDVHVRLMASQCFAKLVSLMSLESGVDSPPEMSETLAARRVEERKFLEQLLDTSKLENYKVPVPIKADLRKYQQDGINWLAFLNKYQLHGILCDGIIINSS